jgi:hypothetical protein
VSMGLVDVVTVLRERKKKAELDSKMKFEGIYQCHGYQCVNT